VFFSVTVPYHHFVNVEDVFLHDTVKLPCTPSSDKGIVWYYQQYCNNFEHGLHSCSSRTAITMGHEYQIRTNSGGEHSLLITDITKTMTGLYTCETSERQSVISRVFVNVICKYSFVLLFSI